MRRTAVTDAQRLLMFEALRGVKGLVIELGVDWGMTTQKLATWLPECQIIAVDSWDPAYHSVIMPDHDEVTAEDKYNAVLKLAASFDNIEVIREDVVECGKSFEGEVGAIFFDAAHDEAAILREFTAWLPHLSAQGVVLVHDTDKGDVSRACDKVFSGHVFKERMCVFDRRSGAQLI